MDKNSVELLRLKDLLRIEYESEKQQYIEQSVRTPIQRLIKRGMCWCPLSIGRSYYNSLNQYVVEVFRSDDEADADCVFEYGKSLQFFAQTEKGRALLPFVATTNFVDNNRMVVVLPNPQALVQMSCVDTLGVQLYFDETSFHLMFESLDKAINATSGRLADFKALFHGCKEASFASVMPMSFPWLNSSQEKAVNKVIAAKDVAIVHGPPGTGKTTTLVECVYETLKRESQVLVCAQSNMAVDWICEQFVDRGVSVLRVGNPSRVTDKMLSFTYERMFEAHPDYHQLWSIRKSIRELRGERRKSDASHQKLSRLREREIELELRINEQIFNDSKVIACTLVGSANKVLSGMHFSSLFIDEAAQAMEPACWIAMRKANRVILAGDHKQLPPTVKSIEAERGGLEKSLMEVGVAARPECVTMLSVQYRMNDAIMRFSSDWFYGGKVQSAPDVQFRGILDYDKPMEWINTAQIAGIEDADFTEQYVGDNFGRINKSEGKLVVETLKSFLERIGHDRILEERISIGVISPYKVQVQYLRQLIKGDAFFRPYRSLISTDTVDGFQGQERDVIVVSLVRSNSDGQIGFLRDLRRMNVAMTRARMKLIIIGNVDTLSHHPFYKKLYEYIESEEI